MLDRFKTVCDTITENRNKVINEESYWDESGKFQDVYEELWKHVPSQGPTEFLETELLRALAKIYYRCYNDGEYLTELYNEDESIVYAYNFIKENAPELNDELAKLIETTDEKSYQAQLDVLLDKFLESVDLDNLTPSTDDYQGPKYRFFDDSSLTLLIDDENEEDEEEEFEDDDNND